MNPPCEVMIGGNLQCSLIAGHGGPHVHFADEEEFPALQAIFTDVVVTDALPVDEVHVWSNGVPAALKSLGPPPGNVTIISTADESL